MKKRKGTVRRYEEISFSIFTVARPVKNVGKSANFLELKYPQTMEYAFVKQATTIGPC